MLINFTLVPVSEVAPWGGPEKPSLHWFGLTDGEYWIEAGDSTLFEYRADVLESGESCYCNYQVVRMYEDLMEMLPHILEPVPARLVPYISKNGAAWQDAYDAWGDRNADVLDPDRFWQIIDGARTWISDRRLDSAHLSPSANILIWSDAQQVHLEWDNRDKLIGNRPAWTALCGAYTLPREEFLAEMRSFHSRLIGQMASRVEQVLGGALSPEISIDLPGLEKEQQQRSHTLDRALSMPVETDWQAVGAAIKEILAAPA